jgi:hypothetical protein
MEPILQIHSVLRYFLAGDEHDVLCIVVCRVNNGLNPKIKENIMKDKKVRRSKSQPMREKNLVSLIWPTNTCYSELIRGIPKGVVVDTDTETWTFRGETFPIGGNHKCSPLGEEKGYPIGIYDKTDFEHLEMMKSDIEWVRERNKIDHAD